MATSLEKLTARERDERWKKSHQLQIRKRAKMLESEMSPADARRKASRDQESVTNRARAQTEGRR